MNINPDRRDAEYGGRAVHLSPQEYKLASLLFAHPSRIVGYDTIIAGFYRDDPNGGAMDAHNVRKVIVCALRRKLRAIGWPGTISTIWHTGYRADVPVKPAFDMPTQLMHKMR